MLPHIMSLKSFLKSHWHTRGQLQHDVSSIFPGSGIPNSTARRNEVSPLTELLKKTTLVLKEFQLIIGMTSVFFLSILRLLPACDSHSQKYVHLFVMRL